MYPMDSVFFRTYVTFLQDNDICHISKKNAVTPIISQDIYWLLKLRLRSMRVPLSK